MPVPSPAILVNTLVKKTAKIAWKISAEISQRRLFQVKPMTTAINASGKNADAPTRNWPAPPAAANAWKRRQHSGDAARQGVRQRLEGIVVAAGHAREERRRPRQKSA